jgi:hypothetical protein
MFAHVPDLSQSPPTPSTFTHMGQQMFWFEGEIFINNLVILLIR